MTAASLVHVEESLAVLRDAGFGVDRALSAFHVLVAYIVGHALATCAVEGAGPTYDALDATRFPRVREAARHLGAHDVEAEFELGLDAMLAGLGVRGDGGA